MGSIVGLGSKEQVDICNNWQKEGYLGNLYLLFIMYSSILLRTILIFIDFDK